MCAAPTGTIVMWCGRPHTFVPQHPANPDKGTQLIGRAGAERAAQITLAPVDQPAQHIYAKFAVIPNGKAAPGDPPFFLECEGNPTTLVAGNNVLPVTSRDATSKALERYPCLVGLPKMCRRCSQRPMRIGEIRIEFDRLLGAIHCLGRTLRV